MSDPYIGQLALVGFNFAPRGWAFCQGQLMSIAENNALFALLGTTYGGDGISSFALPDLRGRAVVGFGQGPGLQNYTQGQVGGTETVGLLPTQIPSHSHTVACSAEESSSSSPTGQLLANGSIYASTPNNTMSPAMIGASGGNQAHENMPPYLVLNWIIALEGVFPPRS